MGDGSLFKDYLELVQTNTGWKSSSLDDLEQELKSLIQQGLLVAASGGPDSQLLLYLMQNLAAKYSLTVPTTFHLDHGLRSSSTEDADLVRKTAAALDLSHYEEVQDVEGFARRMKMNLESAARFLRYRDLFRAAKLAGAEFCATGHHSGDFVETALQRWIRCSSRELKDILPMKSEMPIWSSLRKSRRFLGHLNLLRPLMLLTRSQIKEMLKVHSIPYAEDPTNADPTYQRNALRINVLPELYAQGLNPAALWSVHHDPLSSAEMHSSGIELYSRIPAHLWKNASLSELTSLIRLSLKTLGEDMISGAMLQEVHGVSHAFRRGQWLRVQNSFVEIWSSGEDLWIYRIQGELFRPPVMQKLSESVDTSSDARGPSADSGWAIEWLGKQRTYRTELRAVPASEVSMYRFQNQQGIHTGKIKTLFQRASLPPPVRLHLPMLVDNQNHAVRACLSFLGLEDRIFFLA